jgi:EmrB/QacA subfamily drug resistance transporter
MMTPKRRWLALVALGISVLVLGFDLTILNVALPTMAADIGATTGDLQWIVDSYIVVFAAGMLPAGLIGDRFGRRRMLVAGLVIFLAGSVVGALASTPGPVIAARTIMGFGAALIMPLALAVLPSLFKGEERTKAVGGLTAAMAVGMPFGPLLGGWLLDNFWWGSIFVLNIPLVAVGIVACLLLIPETRDPSAPFVSPLSVVLSVVGLGALVYGVIEAPSEGWTDPVIVAAMVGGALMLVALVMRERRAARPVLDLELLANPVFRWNTAVAVLASFVMLGLIFVLPQYLQSVQGNDAFGTGLRMMPLMVGMLFVARAAPLLIARFGSRPVVVAGLVIFAFALLLGSRAEADSGYGYTALWVTITGFGLGFAFVPTMDAALGALPENREGSGTGLLTTLRQVGAAIGVALLGSLLNWAFTDRLDTDGLPESAAAAARESVVAAHAVAARLDLPQLAASADAAFVHGMGLVLLICSIASLATAVLSAIVLPNERPKTPARAPAESVRGSGDGIGN